MQEMTLEEIIKRTEIKNYILEEENSLLRENVQCLLIDFENMQKMLEETEKEKREMEKITSGKIYKILRKVKTLMKGK
ncbi:MAG: hypothetical protein HFJ33_06845 [Clostridia bacterium]|nr:hypothetical protein [Clostridia bacterium]